MKKVVLYNPDAKYKLNIVKRLEESFALRYANDTPLDETVWAVILAPGESPDGSFFAKFTNLKYVVVNMTSSKHLWAVPAGVEIIDLEDEDVLHQITSTAEHTLGLILAIHRKTHSAHKAVMGGEWYRYRWAAPRMLSQMQVGIIGAGRVGRMLQRMCQSIFKRTWCHDRHYSIASIAKYSDVLVCCASIHPSDSQPIIGSRELDEIGREGIFVNTAQPELVDHEYLLHLLTNHQIRGAALDCIPGEYHYTFPNKSIGSIFQKLFKYASTHDNLLITPHIAGSTHDAYEMTQMRIVEKLEEML